MPRQMPRLDQGFKLHGDAASELAVAGETVRYSAGTVGRAQWSITRIELLYELAYLRVFVAWETFLENVFHRSLCGYASRSGQETLVSGSYFPKLTDAETAVLGGRRYQLWENPAAVIGRCRSFIRSGSGFPAVQETVISSNQTRLEHLAAIRHRIVHEQKDARNKFDAATRAFAGRIYPGSRPGKFLRDWDRSRVPHRRRLTAAIEELTGLAGQMT